MGRPPSQPRNALGVALRARRGSIVGDDVAELLELERGTYYRLERGTHKPSAETALRLARWLGWSVEQVLEAAKQPAPDTPCQDPLN